jgi:hypothetical protein
LLLILGSRLIFAKGKVEEQNKLGDLRPIMSLKKYDYHFHIEEKMLKVVE